MKKSATILKAALSIAVFAILIVLTDPYAARYLELGGTFVYEGGFIRARLLRPGGVATLTASFIAQFFAVKWVGTLVLAAVLTGAAFLYGSFLPSVAMAFLLFGMENCFPYVMEVILFGAAVRWVPEKWRIAGIGIAAAYSRFAFDLLFSQAQSPLLLWLPWIFAAVAALVALVPGVGKKGFAIDAVAAVASIAVLRLAAVSDDEVFFKRLACDAADGKWERIVKVCEVSPSRMKVSFYQNYYHLANAKLGKMTDRLFNFTVPDESYLTVPQDRTLPTDAVLSEVYWSCALVARSLRHTVETNEIWGGYSPYMLERMVAANIVLGYDAAARKNARILGRTLLYRRRAKKYEAFLDGEGRFPELERMMKAGKVAEGFCGLTYTFEEELRQLLDVYPENRVAQQYLFSELILKRNLEGFKSSLESLWERGVLPSTLPEGLQRTIVTYGIADWKILEKYNISEKILSELEEFASRPDKYRKTVWYHLFYVSLKQTKP